MIRRSCCLKTHCLVASLVCLAAGSFCFASCPNVNGDPCLMGHFEVDTVAGSYSDGTPVCTSWSDVTCLNLYVPSGMDNNGLDAVTITPSITIIASHVVGDEARDTCVGSPCDGCPPATAGGSPGTTGGTVTSYKKCCTTVGGSCAPGP